MTAKDESTGLPFPRVVPSFPSPTRLTLRVYLANWPVTLSKPRPLVFGLQASPTKPLPDNWRQILPHAPGGLAVVPWGGLQCASQGPYGDDWTIVEKILEPRRGLKFDEAWFADYARRTGS